MIFYQDKTYRFVEIFNEETGSLLRSDVIIDGKESSIPAPMRSFPELIDVGIMGHCHASKSGLCKSFGVDCYQNGNTQFKENLSLEKFKLILNQCQSRVYQIVLGGAGDPVKHENFPEILELTRQAGIIPNLTTTGLHLTDEETLLISKYCGSVAVSLYSRLDKSLNETNYISLCAIEKLVNAKCKVNIHYVLSRDTIKDALTRLKYNLFPQGISGIIFLLYKPIGEGKREKTITASNQTYLEFLNIVQNNKYDFRIGFDTCQTPALRRFCDKLSQDAIEPCEAAKFSMYIDSDLKAYPCSFACHSKKFQLDLNVLSIIEAWNSPSFSEFREKQKIPCKGCHQLHCHKCVLENGVDICVV